MRDAGTLEGRDDGVRGHEQGDARDRRVLRLRQGDEFKNKQMFAQRLFGLHEQGRPLPDVPQRRGRLRVLRHHFVRERQRGRNGRRFRERLDQRLLPCFKRRRRLRDLPRPSSPG